MEELLIDSLKANEPHIKNSFQYLLIYVNVYIVYHSEQETVKRKEIFSS
jgi:hypothetical protein